MAGDLSPIARTAVRADSISSKERESELRHGALTVLSYVFPAHGDAITAVTVSYKLQVSVTGMHQSSLPMTWLILMGLDFVEFKQNDRP